MIELNSAIRDIVDNQLGSFSGSPYTMPHVHTAIGDGRAVLARRDTKYDEIHIGFTDTLSADSAQGFALTEANLYTREAFDEYLDHLSPDGILSFTRLRRLVGPEAIRVSVLALGTLEHRGVKDPEKNIVVLQGHDILGGEFETTLVRPRPWTARRAGRSSAPLAKQRTNGIMIAPNGPYRDDWARSPRRGLAEVLPQLHVRRVPADRRQAVLLQHAAPELRVQPAGERAQERPRVDPARHARHPHGRRARGVRVAAGARPPHAQAAQRRSHSRTSPRSDSATCSWRSS